MVSMGKQKADAGAAKLVQKMLELSAQAQARLEFSAEQLVAQMNPESPQNPETYVSSV